MLLLTLAASRLHAPPDATALQARDERRRLYALAGVFFALLYAFPAGVVLYWTTGSALALAREGLQRMRARTPAITPGKSCHVPGSLL
jgi:membrane protein insertase Oxa1/YidC/SpoIIIJ